MSENYTPRQLEILEFIVSFRKKNKFSPTLEEIGNALGVHRVTIHQHIGILEKLGAVKRGTAYRRNIQVIDPDITGSAELSDPVLKLLEAIEGLRRVLAGPEANVDHAARQVIEAADLVRGNEQSQTETA